MNPFARFERFLLTKDDAVAMSAGFKSVLPNTKLMKDESLTQLLRTHKTIPGVYFWVLRYRTRQYKIYIGKTKSLAARLLNYVGEFQPHSPNDYKLRIFAAFATELAPTSVLELHFIESEIGLLGERENEAVRKFNPLLNQRSSPTIEAKEKLKIAFEFYYRSAVEQSLIQ